MSALKTTEQADRFWQHVREARDVSPNGHAGCWIWTAALTDGYGRAKVGGRMYQAHRLAYEWVVGKIRAGLEIDHLCHRRCCVNPAHMETVTKRVNVLRGDGHAARNARKTHCLHGHEFTPSNTYVDRRGWRYCRTCHAARQRRRAARAA